jgi:hypothetical protein
MFKINVVTNVMSYIYVSYTELYSRVQLVKYASKLKFVDNF